MTTATASKKKVVTMTEEEVIDLMKETQGEMSLRDFAIQLGVTPGYISDIYNSRRSPGEKILDHFRIGKKSKVIVEHVYFRK